jgi:hypothetical protein
MARLVQSLVAFELPLPPSVNAAFASRGAGSHRTLKTAEYRMWQREVREEFGERGEKLPQLAEGRYGLWIDLPVEHDMRGDIDNREKLLSDVLCLPSPRHGRWGLGVVVDDSAMKNKYTNRLSGLARGRCRVAVVTSDQWIDYVLSRIT